MDAAPSSRTARTRVLLLCAGLIATIPVWIPHYPPMVDLPQHAAQVTLLRELHDPAFPFAHMFEVHWFTPYLIGYAVVYGLAPLIGIVTACKLVVTLALAAMPLSTGLIIEELGGDAFWAVLCTPGLLGVAYCWGLLNFLVAAPVGMLFLWLVMRHAHRPRPRTAAGIALFVNLLFFCHALTCAFFLLIAAGWLLLRTRSVGESVRIGFPLIAVLPLMAQWLVETKSHPLVNPTQVDWALNWFAPADPSTMDGRILGFLPRIFGLPRNAFGPALLLLLAGIAAAAWLGGARPRREVSAWWPVALCVLCLLLVPMTVFGTNVVYPRFASFVLPLAAIAISTRARAGAHRYRVVLLVLLAVWTAVLGKRALDFARETRGFDGLIAQMEPHQRALALIFDRTSPAASAPVFLHFPSWYAAEKGGVADVNFALYFVELVQYRYNVVPRAGIAFGWLPENFRWRNFKSERYRYFVVRTQGDPSAMFSVADCPVRLAYHSGEWWLFDAPPPCYGPAPAAGTR